MEGRVVCAACKPTFVQQVNEGAFDWSPDSRLVEGRELGLKEIFSLSWKVCLQDWFKILVLMALVTIPSHLILLKFDYGEDASIQEISRYFKMNQLLETVVGVFATLGIALIVQRRLSGEDVSLTDAFIHAIRRWLPGIWTGFLSSFVIGLLLLALVVPGIIWWVYYCMIAPIVSLRELSGSRALAESKSLVRGRWWRVFGRILAITAAPSLLAIITGIGMTFLPDDNAFNFASSLFAAIPFGFYAVGITVLFLNLDAITARPVDPAPIATPVGEVPPKASNSPDYDY